MVNWKKYYDSIPAEVQIGFSNYRVFWVDGYPKDNKQLGETNYENEKYISINKNQSIKEAVHTYIHECLHAFSHEFEIKLTENQIIKLENTLRFFLKNGNIFKKKGRK